MVRAHRDDNEPRRDWEAHLVALTGRIDRAESAQNVLIDRLSRHEKWAGEQMREIGAWQTQMDILMNGPPDGKSLGIKGYVYSLMASRRWQAGIAAAVIASTIFGAVTNLWSANQNRITPDVVRDIAQQCVREAKAHP